jgi:uncharacterized membrane protein YphA (DoxX/SURF4 family)
MNIVLWIAQALLALGFLGAGTMHVFRFDQYTANPRTAWGHAVGRSNLRLIGLLEILGALGVILPAVTGIQPWLTGVAAAGLFLVMAGAIFFHLRRREPVAFNAVLGAIALFVGVGRLVVQPF